MLPSSLEDISSPSPSSSISMSEPETEASAEYLEPCHCLVCDNHVVCKRFIAYFHRFLGIKSQKVLHTFSCLAKRGIDNMKWLKAIKMETTVDTSLLVDRKKSL